MAKIESDLRAAPRQVPDWKTVSLDFPLLAALPDAARRLTRYVEVPRQITIFGRGDRPKDIFFVLSGEVRLIRRSKSGDEIVLQRAHRGFLAEASLDQSAYHCDAVAAETSRLLAIPRKAFVNALATPAFRDAWITHLARELRKARAHAERLSLKTARERIVHFIETEGESGAVTLNRPKKDWAAELGLTHEALYRALARMKKGGELDVKESRLALR